MSDRQQVHVNYGEPFYEWAEKALKVFNMLSQGNCIERVNCSYSQDKDGRLILTAKFIGPVRKGFKVIKPERSDSPCTTS